MKLIKPSFQIIPQEDLFKHIELCGRVCYSPDTEVLTDNGWKRIDNLFATDKVVSYNPADNTIIYDNPNLVIKNYEDDMIEIDHPQIKLCVTKDHRIYQSVPEKRNYTFLTASQLAGIERIPHSRQCKFRIPKYFNGVKRNVNVNIPSIVYSKEIKHGYRKSSIVTINIPCTIDFMVIAGAFISEGHTFHGETYGSESYCQITQNENSKLYNKVIASLSNLGWDYKVYSDPRKPKIKWIRFGNNQCWVKAFDDLFGRGSKNKHFPVWFRLLPDEYLKALISTMYLGDGSHNTMRNEKYLSISKRLLEEVQEVFILLGTNGTSNFNEKISQKCYFEESHRDSWIISRKKHVNIIPYSGKVYCTSTKSGIICIRYKGKTCWCGNCYKSEDKITDDSAEKFVNGLIKSGHTSVLEHGTVYLYFNSISSDDMLDPESTFSVISELNKHGYQRIVPRANEKKEFIYKEYFITTNYRFLVENNLLRLLKYQCESTAYHKKRVTVKFICDRGVSHEFVRHRVFSFSQESTRYCNYSKDKFGNELTFIIPCWTNLPEQEYGDMTNPKIFNRGSVNGIETDFVNSLRIIEFNYLRLINDGWNPQQARQILPNALKTELIMTGFVSDWEHFFSLRCAPSAHPQARELAIPLEEEFKSLNLI